MKMRHITKCTSDQSILSTWKLWSSFDPEIFISLRSSIDIGSLLFPYDENQSSPKPLRIVPILTRVIKEEEDKKKKKKKMNCNDKSSNNLNDFKPETGDKQDVTSMD
ncbi:hypothetical protein Bca4012_037173 [Brassica carinata]